MGRKHDFDVSKRLVDFCTCNGTAFGYGTYIQKNYPWVDERFRTMGYLLDNIAHTYRYVYPDDYHHIKYHDNTNIGD